jgi:hypothetical protein
MRLSPTTDEVGAIDGSLSGTVRTHQVGRVNQEPRELTTEQAAALLGVSSDALRGWERRFGYPCTRPSADGEPIYDYWQIAALRDALTRELSITAAIRTAQHALNHSCDARHPEARRAVV